MSGIAVLCASSVLCLHGYKLVTGFYNPITRYKVAIIAFEIVCITVLIASRVFSEFSNKNMLCFYDGFPGFGSAYRAFKI